MVEKERLEAETMNPPVATALEISVEEARRNGEETQFAFSALHKCEDHDQSNS